MRVPRPSSSSPGSATTTSAARSTVASRRGRDRADPFDPSRPSPRPASPRPTSAARPASCSTSASRSSGGTKARYRAPVSIFVADLPDRLDELPRDRRITVFCKSGSRSAIAASILDRAGFEVLSRDRGRCVGLASACRSRRSPGLGPRVDRPGRQPRAGPSSHAPTTTAASGPSIASPAVAGGPDRLAPARRHEPRRQVGERARGRTAARLPQGEGRRGAGHLASRPSPDRSTGPRAGGSATAGDARRRAGPGRARGDPSGVARRRPAARSISLRATSSVRAAVAGSGPPGTSIATTAFRNGG